MDNVVTLLTIGFNIKKFLILGVATLMVIVVLPLIAVFSLGMPTLDWLAATPNAEAAETKGFYMGGPMIDNTYAWGNCTWWAYAMRKWSGSPIPTNWGNANTWDDNARAQGYEVNHTPIPGAIFQTDEGLYGHVAYVIKLDEKAETFTISEMNAPTLNVVSQRTFKVSSAQFYNFIHTKKGSSPWTPDPILLTPPYGTGL